MTKTKTLTCVITGNNTIYSGEFLNKKIEEYGSEEILEKRYVCKEVKSFLKKRYKIKDIRKVLSVDDKIPLPDNETIIFLETTFNSSINTENSASTTITEFTYNKSDKDVEEFINRYIIQK